MNQKALLLALLLLLTGLCIGTFLLWESDDVGPLPSESAASEAPAATPQVTADRADTLAVDASSTSEVGYVMRAAATSSLREQPPLPEDAAWVVITVVDAGNDEPVAGAIVHWFGSDVYESDSTAHLSQHEQSALAADPEAMGERRGWYTATNDKGVARIAFKDSATVVARHEGNYGTLSLQENTLPPPGGYRLHLAPDMQVVVLVVDEHGAPASGVPVTLAHHAADGSFEGFWTDSAMAITSAPDGTACVRHLQVVASDNARSAGPADQSIWHVRTYLHGHDDPGVAVTLLSPPTEPVVLRLPACGRVRVRAECAGQPMPSFTSAWLTEQAEHVGDLSTRNLVDRDGWVRFPWVPVGHAYLASADCLESQARTIAGPLAGGEEVTAILVPDGNLILLRGRMVDADNQPLANQAFEVTARGPLRFNRSFETDAEGRFFFAASESGNDNRIDLMWFDPVRTKHSAPRRAELLPRRLRAGIEDLGDVMLTDGKLIASGRFLCGEQPFTKPIHVSVERFEAANNNRPPRWRRQRNTLDHQTGADFEVRGTVPPGRYRLSFDSEHALDFEDLEFALGATDLTVPVRVGHRLAASALLPAKISADQVHCVLVQPAPPKPGEPPDEHETQPWSEDEGERHHLQWQALPAGNYALEVRLLSDTKPVLRLADVLVPGPEGGDPRLVDIDLRQLLRAVTLRVLQADGEPVESGEGVVFPLGLPADQDWQGTSLEGVPAQLILRPGPADLLITMPGFRPQPVHTVGDTLEVRMDRWPTIELQFANLPSLPNGVHLVAQLKTTSPSEQAYSSQWSGGRRDELLLPPQEEVLVEAGKVELPIGDGLYELTLEMSGRKHSVAVAVAGAVPHRFLSSQQLVQVTVPAEQWQKALEAVKAAPK